MSTGVLIVATWLAADKASFINITLNITTNKYSPASNFVDEETEKILKVIEILPKFLLQLGGINFNLTTHSSKIVGLLHPSFSMLAPECWVYNVAI